ncbi:LCP family protein [Xylanimonas allomyrinae]|uniref:LCP family protein n=1 Tax=Xylanimonas allomyrinae TaxID=2509459 RepID=UPI0013A66DE6|nr:LCP family protein [Xylanimonas allomyrinae]
MTAWPRRRAVVLTAVLALVAAVAADVATIAARVDRVAIPATASTGARSTHRQTWVLVGLDSRDAAPDGPDYYGIAEAVTDPPHADAIVVLTVEDGHATALAVPRELRVRPADGEPDRVGVLVARGWDAFVTGMCEGLGIPTDHLVAVTMRGFAGAVDAVGGVEVTLPAPTRDLSTGLDLPAGVQRLDGVQALSLVRSRHTETLVDGVWQQVDDRTGAFDRAAGVGAMLSTMAARLHGVRSPLTFQRLAWNVGGQTSLDTSTSLFGLTALRSAGAVDVKTLPVVATATPLVSRVGDETRRVLEGAGYGPGACAVVRDAEG